MTELVLTVDARARAAQATVVWNGGETTRHEVRCPPLGWQCGTNAAVLARLRELAARHPDHRVAAQLNGQGFRTRTGKPRTYARVQSTRKQHGIPTGCPLHTREVTSRGGGLTPIAVAAERLGASQSLAHVRVQHGVLQHDQHRSASRVWVRLNDDDLTRLDGSSPTALRLPSFAETQRRERLTREALWDRVRRGEYRAFRARHGKVWQWHLQQAPGLGVGRDNKRTDHHA